MDYHDILINDVKSFTGKHQDIIKLAPNLFDLLCKLTVSLELNHKEKQLIYIALGYFVATNDLYSEDTFGPIGYIDDILITIVVFAFLMLIKSKKMLFFKESPEFVGKKTIQTDLIKCPKCDVELKKENIIKHLKSRHYLKQTEAVDLAADLNSRSDD